MQSNVKNMANSNILRNILTKHEFMPLIAHTFLHAVKTILQPPSEYMTSDG